MAVLTLMAFFVTPQVGKNEQVCPNERKKMRYNKAAA